MTKNILVVDDEPDLVHLYRLVLEMSGFQVETATSGAEALRRLAARPADLILLDVMMPEMDGIEVCRRVRSDADLAAQPTIIMYTANDSAENRQASREAGANDLVSKDVPVEKLTSKINSYFLEQAAA